MALQIPSTHSRRTGRLAGTLLAVVTLLLQPFLPLNIPSAFAASIAISPASHSIDGGQSVVSALDASSYENLTLSFDHIAANLEEGDDLFYGWREQGGVDNGLGVILGEKNTNPGNVPGPNENGTKSVVLPASAAVTNLEIYFTNTGEGNDTVYISNIRVDGTFVVPVDETAPTAPVITAPGAGTWHKTAPITNSWSAASDGDGSGVAFYQIAYNYDDGHSFGGTTCPGVAIPGVSGFIGCRNVNGLTRNHSPGLSEQGGVTIWVRAVDQAGNVSTWSAPIHYYYDATNPSLIVSNLDEGDVVRANNTSNKLTIKGEYSDNLQANYTAFYLIKDGILRDVQMLNGAMPTGSTLAEFNVATLGLEDGAYELQISATDQAGNVYPQTINFMMDNTAPVVEITAPVDGAVVNHPADIHGTVTDDNPRHYWLQIKRNGVAIYSQTVMMVAGFTDQLFRTITADGDYEITLAARDAVGGTASSGNRSNDVTISFTIDTAVPDMPSASLAQDSDSAGVADGGNTNSEFFTFTLGSSSDTVRYQLKYWNDIVGSPFKAGSPWNPTDLSGYSPVLGTYKDRFTQGEGTHYFSFSACDAAGNCSDYSTPFIVTFDITPPIMSLDSIPDSSDTSRTISGITDPFASVEVTVYSTPQTKTTTADANGNWSLLFENLEVGNHTVEVVTTDQAGNKRETESTFTVLASIIEAVTPPAQLFIPPFFANAPTDQPFQQGFVGNNPNTDVVIDEGSDIVASNDENPDAGDVLGEQENEAGEVLEDTDVLGTMDNKFFGFAWYWWLIIVGALISGWLLLAATIRRNRVEE